MEEGGGGACNVLFLCTGNSARSIIAEVILNRIGSGRFRACSAGSRPSGVVNPDALALLRKLGFDVAGLRSKSWDEFSAHPRLDFVFTLCDSVANEACPIWPGQPVTAHWGIPNPAAVKGTPEDVAGAFRDAYDALEQRIAAFVSLPLPRLDRMSLKRRLDAMGTHSSCSLAPPPLRNDCGRACPALVAGC